ncbi:hypothetical protein ABIF99_002230 [Bradyrhizobium japonicum]
MARSPNFTKSFSGGWGAEWGNGRHPARRRGPEKAVPSFKEFSGAKTVAPITIASKMQLDLAIQCSLDPRLELFRSYPA